MNTNLKTVVAMFAAASLLGVWGCESGPTSSHKRSKASKAVDADDATTEEYNGEEMAEADAVGETPDGLPAAVSTKVVNKPATTTTGSTTTTTLPPATTVPVTPPEEQEPATYPVLTLFANGSLTNDGDTYNFWQDLATNMTADVLQINVTACGSSKKQVHDKVKGNTGITTYKRTPKDRLKTLAAQGFKKQSFLIFADSVTKKDGTVFNFDKPIPSYVLPVAAAVYSPLDAGPLVYKAVVNGAWNITVTLSKEPAAGGRYVIKSTLVIAEDQKGEKYGAFPIPALAIYSIDTESTPRVIRDIATTSYYERDGRKETTVLPFKLCGYNMDGKLTPYPCK
jgi:hypothetical protein